MRLTIPLATGEDDAWRPFDTLAAVACDRPRGGSVAGSFRRRITLNSSLAFDEWGNVVGTEHLRGAAHLGGLHRS